MRYRHRFVLMFGSLLLASLMAGCGPGYSQVEVKVTLDGAPLEGATVSLVPKDGSNAGASGITNSSGVATMKSTSDKSGVLAGEYIVTVAKTEVMADPGMPAPDAMIEMAKKGKAGGPGGPQKKGGMPGKGPQGNQPKNLVPAKYSDLGSPQFTITVPTSGTVNLDLKSK